MKTTSCGILILATRGELLLCHVTGSSNWDIPKGGRDPGESEETTAIRETAEEAGLAFMPGDLVDLGRFAYRPAKDLHLYATLLERIDTGLCRCSTRFRDHFGRLRPEMDRYAWTPFADVQQRCAKSMAALLTRSVSLPDLLRGLLAHGHPVKAADAALLR